MKNLEEEYQRLIRGDSGLGGMFLKLQQDAFKSRLALAVHNIFCQNCISCPADHPVLIFLIALFFHQAKLNRSNVKPSERRTRFKN